MIDGPQGDDEHPLAPLSTREPDILDLTVGPCSPAENFDFAEKGTAASAARGGRRTGAADQRDPAFRSDTNPPAYAERLRRLRRTAEARRQLFRVEMDFTTMQAGA